MPDKVDEAARACYEQVKRIICGTIYSVHSASIGVKVVVSNHPNKKIYERIETNKNNKFSSAVEITKVRRRKPQKTWKVKKLTQTVGAAMIK